MTPIFGSLSFEILSTILNIYTDLTLFSPLSTLFLVCSSPCSCSSCFWSVSRSLGPRARMATAPRGAVMRIEMTARVRMVFPQTSHISLGGGIGAGVDLQ